MAMLAVFQFFYRRKIFRISKTQLARTCEGFTQVSLLCALKNSSNKSVLETI